MAAILFGVLGQRVRERDSAIGVVMAFGLGLAVLFIHLYPSRAGTSFTLLTGQIVGVGYSGLALLIADHRGGGRGPAVTYRPLALRHAIRRWPRRAGTGSGIGESCSPPWSVLLRPKAVQIVGALLVMSLLITPAAAAAKVFTSPMATMAHFGGFRRASARWVESCSPGPWCAGVGVRHHHFVPDLSDVLGDRPTPPQSRGRLGWVPCRPSTSMPISRRDSGCGNSVPMTPYSTSSPVPTSLYSFHAGTPVGLARTCRAAADRGVRIGAQVGYFDLAGFGRRRIEVDPDELAADVVYQIGALQALAHTAGSTLAYVKPHGALYNTIVDNREQARRSRRPYTP